MESTIDTEHQVGIFSFLTNHKPLSFAYKYRYTDFVVHEIGTDKQLVPCDKEDLEAWREKFKKMDELNKIGGGNTQGSGSGSSGVAVKNRERLLELVGEEETKKVEEFYQLVNEYVL